MPAASSTSLKWYALALSTAVVVGAVSFGVGVHATGRRAATWPVPEFALIDQRGRPATKQTYQGQVWIADFIFTRCKSVCPLLTARMRELQQKLTSPALRFVSFSIDPEGDTVEALADYAALWAPQETRWSLLHSEPAALRQLVDGMRLISAKAPQDLSPGMHTSLFFLVDQRGDVRGMYDSRDARALHRLVEHVRQLAPEASAAR
ncbi:MAG TPA: SCO family protein [Polyangiales bacterium]